MGERGEREEREGEREGGGERESFTVAWRLIICVAWAARRVAGEGEKRSGDLCKQVRLPFCERERGEGDRDRGRERARGKRQKGGGGLKEKEERGGSSIGGK